MSRYLDIFDSVEYEENEKRSGIRGKTERSPPDPESRSTNYEKSFPFFRSKRHRQRAESLLADSPLSVTHAWLVDAHTHPEYIVCLVAIRGVGTAELSILRERHDPLELIRTIEAAGSGKHVIREYRPDACF